MASLTWGGVALNGLAMCLNVACAWKYRRAERRLRELSLWACMPESDADNNP